MEVTTPSEWERTDLEVLLFVLIDLILHLFIELINLNNLAVCVCGGGHKEDETSLDLLIQVID